MLSGCDTTTPTALDCKYANVSLQHNIANEAKLIADILAYEA
jgi:hypothetical protein